MRKNNLWIAVLIALPTMIFGEIQPRHSYLHELARPQHFSIIYPHLRQVGSDRDFIIGDLVHQIVLKDIRENVHIESITALGYILRNKPASFNFATSIGGERVFFGGIEALSKRKVTKDEIEESKETLLLMLTLDSSGSEEKKNHSEVIRALSCADVQGWIEENLCQNSCKIHYYRMTGPLALNDVPTIRLVSNEVEAFKLTLTEREQECIYTIIKTMGTHSVFGLLKKKKMLTKLGDEIDGVPPLQFLGFIFTHPELPKYMPKIKASVFKWKNLVDGLGRTMKREYQEGKLQPQLQSFAKSVGKDYDKLKSKMDKSDPEGFVVELMK